MFGIGVLIPHIVLPSDVDFVEYKPFPAINITDGINLGKY